MIRREIAKRGLEQAAFLTGKLSSAELAACYGSSQVLVCASEHEGFCVPLLEAMAFGLPVVAYASTAIPETLGNGGILLDSKDPALWCEAIEEIRNKEPVRHALIEAQRERLAELHVDRTASKLLQLVNGLACSQFALNTGRPVVQLQGPFETSYSLAAINRNLALALDGEGTQDVSIYCTEGPGDYIPEESNLADKPEAAWLWQKSRMLSTPPDVVIRNLYPPRVRDVRGKLNLLYIFWEDSLLPRDWVADFNSSLDAVLAPSKHVERVLRESGVTIPIHLVQAGVEERFFQLPTTAAPSQGNPFTFTHVSSGFPRKGVDALLRAYFTEFSDTDNVQLVVKTFPNIHNDVGEQIRRWQERTLNPPLCIHIDHDLPAEDLDNIYAVTDCLVYPTRAEGFGLPIAEAMARRIPVVVTGHGGHMDFCSNETAFLLPYRLAPSRSHVAPPGATWAEPDPQSLRSHMRFVYENRGSEAVRRLVEAAYKNISENFRWANVAVKVRDVISKMMPVTSPHVAMVSSWNSRCGIAEYSRYLIEAATRRQPRLRIEVLSSPVQNAWLGNIQPSRVCWKNRVEGDLTELRQTLACSNFDLVHFQFNFSFYDLLDLAQSIGEAKQAGKKVAVTFHSTADVREKGILKSLREIADILRLADLLLVHSPADRQCLAGFGLIHNVRLLPHGNLVCPYQYHPPRKDLGIDFNPAVGTFGFLLPHKGMLELLEAISRLKASYPQIGLLAQCSHHQDEISVRFEGIVRQRIRELDLESSVLLSTDFLPNEEAILFLQAADVLVLPYKKTAESASGAVRFALTAGRPVVTTWSEIFNDVSAAVYQISSSDPREIAEGVTTILRNPRLGQRLVQRAREHVEATSWDRVADQYLVLLRSLLTADN
jgi:glycosyltransferase involved in cell wall biosynthesis